MRSLNQTGNDVAPLFKKIVRVPENHVKMAGSRGQDVLRRTGVEMALSFQ